MRLKKLSLGLLVLWTMSAAASAEDLNARCCKGLAPGAAQYMIRKDALDTAFQFRCGWNLGVTAISFGHKFGENLTYQEDVGVNCYSFKFNTQNMSNVNDVMASDESCRSG